MSLSLCRVALYSRCPVGPSRIVSLVFLVPRSWMLLGCHLCRLCMASCCSSALIAVSMLVDSTDTQADWLCGLIVIIADELLCGSSPYGVGFAVVMHWCLFFPHFGCVICQANLVVLWYSLSWSLDVLILGLLGRGTGTGLGKLLPMPEPIGSSHKVICIW